MAKKGQAEAAVTTGNPSQNRSRLKALMQVPPLVVAAASTIETIDRCLHSGFGRLGNDQSAGLASISAVLSGTPLEKSFAQALAGIKANEFRPEYFAAMAVARAALQRARHDALIEQAHEALERKMISPLDEETSAVPANVLCESARHWLMELAIAGLKQLDTSTLAPFAATLESIQGDPSLARLACVLTGFHRELLAALPIGHDTNIPLTRWGDLWMRAMVSSLQAARPDIAKCAKVSGPFYVLGVDLRQADCFVSAVVYGLLKTLAGQSIVRVTLSFKVDALQGKEVWRCFGDESTRTLLEAISCRVPLDISGMTFLPSGDLLWDGKAKVSAQPADIFALAAEALAPGASTSYPTIAPSDRHPVQIAELVLLDGLKVEEASGNLHVVAGEVKLPIDAVRIPPGSELTADAVAACDTMIALLRFDGGHWLVQPLAVRSGEGKKAVDAFVGSSAYEVVTTKPKKGEFNTLAVLQERASRLLRKKS